MKAQKKKLEDDWLTPLELFPEEARLIGLIVATWSTIEYEMVSWLTFRHGVNDDVLRRALFAIQSSSGRLAAMKAAFSAIIRDPEERKLVDDVLKEASSLLGVRDKYAHGLYSYGGPDGTGDFGLQISRESKGKTHPLPAHDLTHELQRMNKHLLRIQKLCAQAAIRQARRAAPPQ